MPRPASSGSQFSNNFSNFSSSTIYSFYFPNFVGDALAEELGVNLLAIADPSVSLHNEVRLGWYLGNRAIGRLDKILVPVIERALAGMKTRRTIFFGNSGGGYAALDYGSVFEGSIILTVNPRLRFGSFSTKDFGRYMRYCHPGLGSTPYKRVYREYARDLVTEIPYNSKTNIFMYQNLGDYPYLENDHKPFVFHRKSDLSIYERLEQDGEGHFPVPRYKLVEILTYLSSPVPLERLDFLKIGFQRRS